MDVVIITNIPAPYREKQYEILNTKINFTVIYCSKTEYDRNWNFNLGNYKYLLLKKKSFLVGNRESHFNIDVIGYLKYINPEYLIISGLTPTMILAFIWGRLKKKKLLYITDASLITEKKLTLLHSLLRRIIFKKIDAFIGVGEGSKTLFDHYNITSRSQYFAPYTIDSTKYNPDVSYNSRDYHIMYSGAFIERKMPFFFLNVVKRLKVLIPDLKVMMIGAGPLEDSIKEVINSQNLQVTMPGFIQQNELPYFYNKSKIFLFPTLSDGWGVVANEACAAGMPIITTPGAGCKNIMVRDKQNGFILNPIVETWVEKILFLLKPSIWERYSEASKIISSQITAENSVLEIIKALNYVSKNGK